MRHLRITFVLPYAGLAGGVRVIARVAQDLQRAGHQVTLVSTPSHRSTLTYRLLTLLRKRKWIHYPKVGPSHFDRIDVPHILLDRPRPVRDSDLPDADVVIATWWETAEAVAALPRRMGAKVFFLQDLGAIPQEMNRVRSVWSLPLHIITISPWLQSQVKAWAPEKEVSLIPNAPDPETFHAPARGKQAQPTVGFRYHPAHSKGCDLALEAIRLARERIPELKVVVYGEGPPIPGLLLPEGATFLCQPSDEELRQVYAQCDAWLVTSRVEGFGLPILEAMACRTPVISTPVGAAPELVTPQNGFLTQPEDPQDIARAIITVCSLENEAWKRMSESAYAATTSYTARDAMTLWNEVLDNVIRETP